LGQGALGIAEHAEGPGGHQLIKPIVVTDGSWLDSEKLIKVQLGTAIQNYKVLDVRNRQFPFKGSFQSLSRRFLCPRG
jgi:hypothetical protein